MDVPVVGKKEHRAEAQADEVTSDLKQPYLFKETNTEKH
jgi:hypothetical protein